MLLQCECDFWKGLLINSLGILSCTVMFSHVNYASLGVLMMPIITLDVSICVWFLDSILYMLIHE